MTRALRQQYLSALDLSVIALHWLARGWGVAPGVAFQIRRIADALAARARKTRDAVARGEPTNDEVEDPLDPDAGPAYEKLHSVSAQRRTPTRTYGVGEDEAPTEQLPVPDDEDKT